MGHEFLRSFEVPIELVKTQSGGMAESRDPGKILRPGPEPGFLPAPAVERNHGCTLAEIESAGPPGTP